MKFDWSIAATMGVLLTLTIVGGMGSRYFKGAELAIFVALLVLVGIAAAAAIVYFKNKPKQAAAAAGAAGGTAAPAAGGNSEVDTLVHEADQRLAQANAGATTANLPLIFVIGDRSTAKTSTVINSGIEPELLAGQLYQDNTVAPTRAANLWFARGTAIVEAGGAILGDPGNWLKMVKRLQPGKMKSLKGGAQSPRAVLLCVSLESFAQPGGLDAIQAAARYLQARLADISQTLGIRFPVYILFTKTDRVPFFTEYVGTFNNDEASQVFGATVAIRPPQQGGVYAEDETRRLTSYFDNLFYSLCDKRTVFPPRDNEIEKICGAYEFPREMRKIRDVVVQFMVDVCRPSQLTTSPFLRGFYFSGVRPVVVSDAAPMVASRPQQNDYQAAGSSGATGMFRVGKQAEIKAQQSVAQPVAATRKVPQWMFLGHLFNNVIFSDTAAMSASGSSVKVSALRRGLLIAASALCLVLSGIFVWSYLGNRALEKEALAAAAAIPAKDVPAGTLPPVASLQKLETLRQSLEKLDGYETDGAPYSLRWGLYRGSDMYPEVRRLYFAKFKALLFGQTQAGLLKVMNGVKSPPAPTADYKYPYDTLKGYLLTTSEYKRATDTSLRDFVGSLLLTRWSENREPEIGKDRMDLAKKQFDYYARGLSASNPYSDKPDADSVKNTRVYLSGFKGPQRVYMALLGDTAKQGKPVTFNSWAEGSSAVLISVHPVAFAYTKPGSKYMQDQIAKANFGGEKWVLGEYAGQSEDTATMQKGITDLYTKDYINQWRAVLATSKFVSYTDLKDAVKKLSTLTSSTAPILALFSWTSQNTAIDLPGVKEAFRAVQQVEPPTALAYVPSAQPYNDSLQNLQAAIEKIEEPLTETSNVKPAQEMADAARRETRKISSTLPADPEAHVETVIGELMLKPITDAERILKPPSPAEGLNKAGAGFCGSFGPITKRFPFTRGNNDAERVRNQLTQPELDTIFKPKTGKLWLFVASLEKVIDCTGGDCKVVEKPPVAVNPEFLKFLRQAVKFSHAIYGDAGTDPKWQFTMKPKKATWVKSYEIEANGQAWKTDGDEQKGFVWPGGPKQNFILKLDLGGGPLPIKSFDGLWAVFRFLADANRFKDNSANYEFVWNFRSGQGADPEALEYAFTVDTNGVPIFSSDLAKCISVVAK